MDERRDQIRERAGLEEARLNQEFIDFLRKWSWPVLLVIAAASVGYALYTRVQQARSTELTQAFAEFEGASSSDNPNPDALLSVADAYPSTGAIPYLARLEAADIYLDAARRGVKPGASVKPDGTLENPEDLLKEDDRAAQLAKARESYQWVVDKAGDRAEVAMHALGGLYGLAAVAESGGKFDEAKASYERVIALAERAGFTDQAKLARARIESLGVLAAIPGAPSKADVPTPLDNRPVAQTPAPALPAGAGLDLSGAATQLPVPPSTPAPAEPVPTEPAPTAPAPTKPAPAPEPK
jgi:tetratricopeptide (TPR) repeat protein